MKIKIRKNVGAEKKEATQQRPAGATSTGDGEPLPGAEKKEATTQQRPAGATSTGDGEPLPGAEKKEATTRQRPAGATSIGDREPLPGPKMSYQDHRTGGGNLPGGRGLLKSHSK